jgi:hypothetical protein
VSPAVPPGDPLAAVLARAVARRNALSDDMAMTSLGLASHSTLARAPSKPGKLPIGQDNEVFDTGPQRSAGPTLVIPSDYTQPIPGTDETSAANQNGTKLTIIHAPGATIVLTPQTTLSTDTDNSLPSPYWIDERGNTGTGHANVDNISSGWPRKGPFEGEAPHIAKWKDIHSCVKTCQNAPSRIPISALTQHQADYLASGGVRLAPADKTGVRRPMVVNGRILMHHQLTFADGSSPNPDAYNDRVRNSADVNANPGGSVITVNADSQQASYGISGDSQGLYNAEGSPPQVAAAGTSSHGFISIYLREANDLVTHRGRILVSTEEFTQARIDASVGAQYRAWLAAGGIHVLRRALVLTGAAGPSFPTG